MENLDQENRINEYDLSIVIPVYNKKERIESCIESMKQNTKYLYEVIFVDDYSTDGTREIVEKYCKMYENFRIVINDKNRGAGFSRNVGIVESRAKNIWFVDADDTIERDVLDYLIEQMYINKLDVLFFDSNRKSDSSDYQFAFPYIYIENEWDEKVVLTGYELLEQFYLKGRIYGSICRQIISKSFIEKYELQFLENSTAEDILFALELFYYSKRVKYIRNTFYNYYIFEKSVTYETSPLKKAIDDLYTVREILIRLGTDNNFYIIKYVVDYLFEVEKIFRKYSMLEIEKAIEQKDSTLKALYYLLFMDRERIQEVRCETLEIIKEENNFIIYGAGKFAKYVAQIVNAYGKRIIAYAVSDNHAISTINPKCIYGVEVKEIGDLAQYKNNRVIIATSGKFIDEIMNNLRKYGFEKITLY